MPQRMYETCTVDGCHRKHKAAGFCATHYAQHRRGYAPTPIKSRDRRHAPTCREIGCGEPVKAKGLCKMHYARLLRHGFTKYRDRKRPAKACSVAGCENDVYAKGLCSQHYGRVRKLRDRYGLTMDRVAEMLDGQGGNCAICAGQQEAVNGKSLKPIDFSVDHDHATGRVRGILCARCNRALGLFLDSADVLRAAIAYLETHAVSRETVSKETENAHSG